MPSVSIPAAIGSALSGIIGTSAVAAGSTAAAAGTIAGASGAAIDLGTVVAATPELAGTGLAGLSVPAWMGYGSTALSALGGVAGAVGSITQAGAESNAAKYNAAVAGINAQQAQVNARLAAQSGEAQAQTQELKTRAEVGQIRANTAASGIDVNKGSALDVRSSASELGELDALTVRSNAARTAYGYQTQATSFETQQGLDLAEAQNYQEAGTIGAVGSLLGGGAQAGTNYLKFLQAGNFSA